MSALGGKCAKIRWVGLDGEGLGRKPHRYVLMMWAAVDGPARSVARMKGLSTKQCLDFILSTPKEANVCGFFLGYDWTKILVDLPNKKLYRLCRPELRARPKDEGGGFTWVHWRGYRLHYLAGAMWVSRGDVKRVVWDVGKYYQSTFVEAVEKNDIDCNRKMIERMKAARATFKAKDFRRIKKYCGEECGALARLATKLDEQHRAVNVRPRAWHGPGSTAGAVLRTHRIQELRGDPPQEVRAAADYAFFGGRFEHSCIGRKSPVWGYDITSAYPNQTQYLPCLLHARWRRVTTERRALSGDRFACVHYRVHDVGPRAWGPLPCRLQNGTIVYARGGFSGWAWQDEYRVAVRNWRGIEFLEAWVCDEQCDCVPFGFVAALFQERIKNPGNKQVLKFILNSLYGKLAQTVGNPAFASRIWAGIITSGTRAQLLQMLLRHRDERNVYALATDGLYSGEDIDVGDRATPKLGAWEKKYEGEAWFVRPGIYWSDHTLRARGLGRRVFDAHRKVFMRAIERGDAQVTLSDTPQFGTARQHVRMLRKSGRLVRGDLYGEWYDVKPKSSLLALPKRDLDWSLRMLDDVESRPYSKGPELDALVFERIALLIGGNPQ